jgi:pyruvate dehydrogenase E2 component (dihydrolipoamide acetyltransferase)
MVTSIGMFGIPQGFAPLARFYKMPLLVLVGEIGPKPVAVDGEVVVRPVLPLTATIDHRYADGWHISQLIRPFRAYLEDPQAFEPDPHAVSGLREVPSLTLKGPEPAVPEPEEAASAT